MILGQAGAGMGVGLERAESGIGGKRAVLGRRSQENANRAIGRGLVVVKFHGRGRQRNAVAPLAHRIQHIHAQGVGRGNRQFARVGLQLGHTATTSHQMAVLGGRFDAVHHDLGKVLVTGQRHRPFDLVILKAACARQMHQDGLIHVLVHELLRLGPGHAALVVGRAEGRHGVAHVDGESRLVDAQLVLAVGHADTLALGVIAAHDGVATNRVVQMEGDLVAFVFGQVLRLHNRHGGFRLLAACSGHSRAYLGHGARQVAHLRVALAAGVENTHGLLNHVSRCPVRGIGFARAHGWHSLNLTV